jgi:hypothetical protein
MPQHGKHRRNVSCRLGLTILGHGRVMTVGTGGPSNHSDRVACLHLHSSRRLLSLRRRRHSSMPQRIVRAAFPRPLQPGGELWSPATGHATASANLFHGASRPRHLFQVGRARDCLVSPVASLPIDAGTFLLHFPRQQVDTSPSHRINTLAYANGAGTRPAGKRPEAARNKRVNAASGGVSIR